MDLTFTRTSRSIVAPPTERPIADFVVISGPNGSGKSNLLQAIAEGAILVDSVGQPSPQGVRHFALAQLMVTADDTQSRANFRDRHVQLYQQLDAQRTQLRNYPNNLEGESLTNTLRDHLIAQRQISERALTRLTREAGKPLAEMDLDDFRLHAGLLVGIRDPFTLSVTELFLAYHDRYLRNKWERWLVESEEEPGLAPMPDDDFVSTFGPAPWKLLDDTLALMKLDYKFVPPSGTEETRPYEAELLHLPSGISVKMAELSSGEKALLAIAMSLYSDSRWGEAMEIPRVLLLDESDASLHPSMVQSLLQVVGEVFSGRLGVKVIMTTHSPTTFALAPEESLYVMRRNENPRLIKASRDSALASLTVGLPTLSISTENRRQVFVESEYDEACYQQMFAYVRSSLSTPYSLVFIAAGKGESGGSEAVKHLVTTLRTSGNTAVFGIVDRDKRGGAASGIFFNSARYSIENVVLDPLLLVVYLLRNGWVQPATMGLNPDVRHFELKANEAQPLINYVVAQVMTADEAAVSRSVEYSGGFSAQVPAAWLDTPGHDLEARLVKKFPQLNAPRKNLKLDLISKAMRDVQDFIPADAVKLFKKLTTR